jgi:hypothetical protein
METSALKAAIRHELPTLLREDPSLREYILDMTRLVYVDKQESEDRILKVLAEMRRDREEQSRKWDENQNIINKLFAEIKAQRTRHESSLGALGARWGLYSEQAFRNGLKAILEETFGVKVLNVTEYDDSGEVFGHPDQVELDMIIFNGMLILCEIKSSMSKSEMYAFDRKTIYYEKRHHRKVTRKIVISPMVDDRAREVARHLGIEVYSHSSDVPAT